MAVGRSCSTTTTKPAVATYSYSRSFAARPERVWILAPRDEIAKLHSSLPLREVARDPDPKSGYLLLTQR